MRGQADTLLLLLLVSNDGQRRSHPAPSGHGSRVPLHPLLSARCDSCDVNARQPRPSPQHLHRPDNTLSSLVAISSLNQLRAATRPVRVSWKKICPAAPRTSPSKEAFQGRSETICVGSALISVRPSRKQTIRKSRSGTCCTKYGEWVVIIF